jgi:hypothetical protein
LNVELSNLQIVRLAAGVLGTVGVAAVLWGQQADSPRQGISLVTDWSHHHLVYSQQSGTDLSSALHQEPRYWQQWLRRNGMQSPITDSPTTDLPTTNPFPENASTPLTRPRKKFKRDWAKSLGPGATVGAGQYPAKFSFDVTSANCGGATQPDFVAFNTSVPGSATQASIVAFDNLYSGCIGTVPATYWAYNTGGTALTSTTLSLDGSQLAFVQSSAGHAQLVLLKWQASTTATSTSPGPISVVTASQYPTCTLPCMTALAFSGGANDTNSSPYYDYSNDVLYAGDDSGTLHKFTPVFTTETPSEVTATTSWPVALAPGLKLTSPVYDQGTGRVFVGSGYSGSGSQLFAVVGTTGAIVGTSSSLGKGAGIFSSMLVDSSAGKVLALVGNDGTTACSGPCSAVYQFAANFTSGAGIKATVGFGGTFPLYDGTFDNAYYTSANGTGSLYVCGGGGFSPSEPAIFRIPVTSGAMSTSSVAGPPIGTSNTACSPVTEVFNPAAGGTDRIFASVPNGSDAAPCSSGSCVNNLVIGAWQPSTSYAVGQLILDPANFWQVVATAGTANSGSSPSWVNTCGLETTDGTVTWTNAGFLTPVTPQGWQANTFWSVGSRIIDSNNNLECNLQTGIHSAVTPPIWNTAIGGLTTEVTGLQWRNGGPMASHALPVAGGASGIIMDNIVGSGVLAGASEIYFSTLGTGGCGAGNGCAVQASQSALN